jgi:hypothetical protein
MKNSSPNSIECWSLAGSLQCLNNPRRKYNFTMNILSYLSQSYKNRGHELSYVISEEGSGKASACSIIDLDLKTIAIENLQRGLRNGFLDEYAKAYLESLETNSVPKPHRIINDVYFSTSALDLRFGHNRLGEKTDGSFQVNIEDKAFTLILEATPQKSMPQDGNNCLIDLNIKMNSLSYPRTLLSGLVKVDGDEFRVNGFGWFDHMWGGWSKFSDFVFKEESKIRKEPWHLR